MKTPRQVYALLLVLALCGGIIALASRLPTPPCMTHVPNPRVSPSSQCQHGARLTVSNGAALCVCPGGYK